MLIAEIGIGLLQNFRYYLSDRIRIYNEGIVSVTGNILKFTVSEEYDNRINWNVGILWQTSPNGLDMSGVLHDRVIKAMLFFTIRQ